MAEYRLKTPKGIEKAVTGAYQAIENSVVGAYQKIEDAFVEKFLETKDSPAVGSKGKADKDE